MVRDVLDHAEARGDIRLRAAEVGRDPEAEDAGGGEVLDQIGWQRAGLLDLGAPGLRLRGNGRDVGLADRRTVDGHPIRGWRIPDVRPLWMAGCATTVRGAPGGDRT